jgi:L-lysine 2,3-aminomutase
MIRSGDVNMELYSVQINDQSPFIIMGLEAAKQFAIEEVKKQLDHILKYLTDKINKINPECPWLERVQTIPTEVSIHESQILKLDNMFKNTDVVEKESK